MERGSESDKLDSGGIGDVSEYSALDNVSGTDDSVCNKENECVAVAKSMLSAAEISDGVNFVKPLASARFTHRRRPYKSDSKVDEEGDGGGGRTAAKKQAPNDGESMSLSKKAVGLYVGKKGLLFWLNKFAYASIFIVIGGWIHFWFVGPALNL